MRFASLGSGSSGNATLVEAGGTLLMTDCGFSLRQTELRMARLGVEPGQLDAILVTHEHGDHSSGVARLSRAYDIPVYLSRGTWASGRCKGVARRELIRAGEPFAIGAITVSPVAVPHDAAEPCQFLFSAGALNLGVLTDLGCVTPEVVQHYRRCHGLLLECNHDTDMLRNGPYPPPLRERVGGDHGHLNNHQAADLLSRLEQEMLQHLVIGHISAKNNCPEKVRRTILPVYDREERIVWADQSDGFGWLQLG